MSSWMTELELQGFTGAIFLSVTKKICQTLNGTGLSVHLVLWCPPPVFPNITVARTHLDGSMGLILQDLDKLLTAKFVFTGEEAAATGKQTFRSKSVTDFMYISSERHLCAGFGIVAMRDLVSQEIISVKCHFRAKKYFFFFSLFSSFFF